MKKTILILTVLLVGCQSCGTSNIEPNIRKEPGAEDCPAFCDKMAELGQTDPSCLDYLLDAPDGGTEKCVEWCVSTQNNSVQLHPKCMAMVSSCNQVDCASRLSSIECQNLNEICK